MHDLAAVTGRLLGTMLNPFLWLVVFLALIASPRKPAHVRIGLAVIASTAIGSALYWADSYLSTTEKAQGLFFAALATPLICLVLLPLLRRLERRRRA